MQPRFAVIDLGTNTFHILAAEKTDTFPGWKILFKERIFVNLAEDGIRHIGMAPWQRGIDALSYFMAEARALGIQRFAAVGTAALRGATNAAEFVRAVKQETGLEVEIIPGDREAALIAKGVAQAIEGYPTPVLVLDIGGGSNECIILNQGKVDFAKSYPCGIAVLHQLFHRSEPISPGELENLFRFLDEQFADLRNITRLYPALKLAGAAGSFEVVETMIGTPREHAYYTRLSKANFTRIFHQVSGLDLYQRKLLRDVPESRARYLVMGMALIAFFLELLPAEDFLISDFALKEGMAKEICEILD